MSKQYTRRVSLDWSPNVEVRPEAQKIKVTTGSWAGTTRYDCSGELSIYCARSLILDLRKALRTIRDTETRKLKEIVEAAEQPL